MRKKKDLYDDLEVSKDASQEEVKKAYRKKAMQHHPDRGGDAEEFKVASRAYRVLGSKEKRERYDAGETWERILDSNDDQLPLKTIADLFVRVIDQIDEFIDVFELLRGEVHAGQKMASQQIKMNENMIGKYKRTIKKIKSKAKQNVFAAILDNKIEQCEKTIASLIEQRAIGDRMLEILDDYEYEAGNYGTVTVGGVVIGRGNIRF
jgi:DnaJ-class molecular chaperone